MATEQAQATGGNMVIPSSTQETKPSRPLAEAFPRATLGDSGTLSLRGFIREEYNPTLQGIEGIKVYDEMRKTDGTVRASMLVTTLPIRRAKWFVTPASEEQADKDIANFVEHALFDWIQDMTWDDILRQALLMIPFGVMAFEKVYGVKEYEGKTYVCLEKLAPRLPKSIYRWELNDGTFGIQQLRQDGQLVDIPGSKLLLFVNEREGDNWWGTSMLRAAYKHWYMKNKFYDIDAMAFERQGLGVPKMMMPAGYTAADEAQAKKVLQNLRANEEQFLILPSGYDAEFMNMGSSTTRDPQNSINHHNKEMLQSVLAQFLELGTQHASSGGSRALSQDHSALFLNAEEAIANTITGVVNKGLIPEMVDLNFNGVKNYPILDYSGISEIDMQQLSTAYGALVTAGALNPTEADQQYIRGILGLPPRTQDDIDQSEQDQADAAAAADELANQGDEPVDDAAKKAGKNGVKAAELKKKHLGRFTESGFWRDPMRFEENINWKKLAAAMDAMEADFVKVADEILSKAKDQFMRDLHDALERGDTGAIAVLEMGFKDAYKTAIVAAMKRAHDYGKNTASNEIALPTPATDPESMGNIDVMAEAIASKAAADLTAKAKLAAANAITNNRTPLQAAGEIDSQIADAIATSVGDTSSVLVGQGINNGRYDVFERHANDIYALQRSELLDNKTCNFCLSMDGLIVELTDPWASQSIFHGGCRGIWAAILKDEVNPPPITGVPSELGDYYAGQPNALVQPPRPIVRKNTAAADEVEKRKKEK